MPDAHKNFAYSTVATVPSPATTGTSLVVQTGDGAKFPTPPFNVTVWPAGAQPLTTNAEIVRVTAISVDTMTITRTQEGTTARAILVGDQIAATITAKTLTDVESGGGAPQISVIPLSATYTTPAIAKYLDVVLVAGGGGGGGSNNSNSGGGGGGSSGFGRKIISNPLASYTVTIGVKGNGGVGIAAGGNGGDSTFGSALTVKGGQGGGGGSASPGAGGAGGTAGTGGDINLPGIAGQVGQLLYGTVQAPFAVGGPGGSTPLIGGGGFASYAGSGLYTGMNGGSAAPNSGAGGGGGAGGDSNQSTGGDGAAGICIVTAYF
jgi:hypothetical protein